MDLNSIMAALHSHLAEIILSGLLLLSEGLAMIPSVQANSVFQAVVNGIKWLKDKLFPAA